MKSSFITRLSTIGSRPEDSDDLRIKKRSLVYLGALMSVGGVTWGSLFLGFGFPTASVIPFGYTIITTINFLYFEKTKRFEGVRFFQVFISLFFPFLLQWILGGYASSGAVMYWAIFSVLGSFTFSTARQTLVWIFLFVVLAVASAIGDPWFQQNALVVPMVTSATFFALNMTVVSAASFFLFYYFVTQTEFASELSRQAEKKIASQEKLAVLGEMSAGIAHEINNPLAIILGHAELLEQYTKNLPPGDPKSASIQASTKSIIATTQRISRIVKALLTFSRRGDAETKEDVSVEAMVDDVLAICQERVKTRGIEIRKRIPKGISIHGNLMQLSQVLLNLVSNALGALEPLELQWIELAATENSQTVEISVTDAGNGIPSEIRDKIMQPFFTTKEVGKGTGLGLSISKGIIDSHHGELVLDEKCPNTRFVITLPKFTATQERKSAA